MKKVLAGILSLVFVFQFSVLSCCAQVNQTKVKAGTVVPVAVNSVQNSKNVAAGSKIEASVERDVIVDDIVVFKKGDRATINVVQAKKAGFVGIPGELTVAGGEIYDTNGAAHYFDFSKNYVGEEKTWPKVCLGCGLLIILAPIALFGFVKGGQAEIKPYMPIEVRVSQDFEFVQNL